MILNNFFYFKLFFLFLKKTFYIKKIIQFKTDI